jgi:hypothetical protein
MSSVGLPKGLIRYASEDEIEKKAKFTFTTRMKGYTAVLVILVGEFCWVIVFENRGRNYYIQTARAIV